MVKKKDLQVPNQKLQTKKIKKGPGTNSNSSRRTEKK